MSYILKFNPFLNEEKLSDKYNLDQLFNELNHEMWNGVLDPIPLKWENNKSTGGRVISKRYPDGREEIEYLGISTFYNISYEQLRNIMAHELIHVYMIQNNIKDYGGYHGMIFKDYMKKFNQKGFNITILHDVGNIGVASSEKLKKPVGVILYENQSSKSKTISVLYQKYY